MQVFAITFPFAMLLSRFPKATVTVLVLASFACSTFTALRTYFSNLLFGMTTGTNDGRRVFKTLELIYFRPITHVATYVSGILAGYAAVKYSKARIPRVVQIILWAVSTGAAWFVLFVTLPWNRENIPGPITNAIYGGYHRLLWSLSLCWPAYACATGYGGILGRISSWKGFLPLARLTYGVYLLHGVFLLLRMGLVKTRFNLDDFFQLTNTLGIITLSYYFAYLLFLACEGPIANIFECVLDHKDTKTSQSATAPSTTLAANQQIRRLP
ncbi:nose resistant to fluoxetine protein 6-like [Amblyomma americanum]